MGPQRAQHVLAGVCQALQLRQPEEPAGALEGVHDPEHPGEQLVVSGSALEQDQVPVELVEVFAALLEKGEQDLLVLFVHLRPPPADSSRNRPTSSSSSVESRASCSAARCVSFAPSVVVRADSATPLMLRAISPEPCAASVTERPISFVVAACSSTAAAMTVWMSLICWMIAVI